jgi:hypothetical protein
MSLPPPPGPPLTPTVAAAREQLQNELSKPQYQAARPTLFDILWKDIVDWFESLTSPPAGTGLGISQSLILTVVAVIVIAGLIVGFVLFGVPRLNRRSRISGSLFGLDDDRDAAALRRAAEQAAAARDYALAIEEEFRAIARGLSQRGVVTTFPGTTAHGFAGLAAVTFPESAGSLERAATLFDGVRYLGEVGTEKDWIVLRTLESTLRETKPRLETALT